VTNVIITLALTRWVTFGRVARGQTLAVKEREYVLAARALGASNRRIIWRHLIPNSVAPLVVFGTLAVADFILVESALSFLGLGISPPTPSWGNMLSAFQGAMRYPEARWMVFLPGSLIFLAVISINFVGDGLRDALDPWLRNR
jgi:peptide/nickel transport system permease protein